MVAADLIPLLQNPQTYDRAVTLIKSRRTRWGVMYPDLGSPLNTPEAFLTQYETRGHAIFSRVKRPLKSITNNKGQTKAVDRARLSVPLQKKIVNITAAFLLGNPIELDYTVDETISMQQDFVDILTKVWDDNKLDYKSKKLAKILFSECEVAELWYTPEVDKDYWAETQIPQAQLGLRMRIIANSLGDLLYPVFDNTGDMIAFGRAYRIYGSSELNLTNSELHFDVYTEKQIFFGVKESDSVDWTVETKPNILNRIPIIYYSQPLPEWHDVQTMIERYETLISNLSDTNDYFGDPTVIVKGTITGFSQKGEQGKMLQLDPQADVSYLTWDRAPESIKMELESLWKLIHTSTSTPDINFEHMRGLGQFSGIALKMLFMDAHLKAADKEETFGEGVQRRINLIKSSIGVIGGDKIKEGLKVIIKPKFTYYLPADPTEEIANINSSINGGTLSKMSGVRLNPLVQSFEEEWVQIQAEQETAAEALNKVMGGANPPKVIPKKSNSKKNPLKIAR